MAVFDFVARHSFEILVVPFILAFGIITSYEDMHSNKIRNKWIAVGLSYAFLALAASSGLTLVVFKELNRAYFFTLGTNLAIGTGAAVAIWLMGLWSAADAKLFIAYLALVPLFFYQWGRVDFFPGYTLLINTFTPYLAYFVYRIVFKTSLKVKLSACKATLNPSLLLQYIVFIFAFAWIVSAMFRISGIPQWYGLSFAVLFFLFILINDVLKINILAFGIVVSVVRIVVGFKSIFALSFMVHFLVIIVLFILLRIFILYLGYALYTHPIYIEQLKEGAILAEEVVKTGKNTYTKKQALPAISFLSLILHKDDARKVTFSQGGLTAEDIKKITSLHSEGKLKEHSIRVYQTTPFAPFIFSGVLLTLVCEGNFVYFIRSVIESFL